MCGGRPRCRRRVSKVPDVTYFKPRGIPLYDLKIVVLTLEEMETLRLIDLEGLEQEQAAKRMGVSRRAFWNDLQSGRKKVADALVNGKAIEIKGGHFLIDDAICGRSRRRRKGRRCIDGRKGYEDRSTKFQTGRTECDGIGTLRTLRSVHGGRAERKKDRKSMGTGKPNRA